MDKVRVLLKFIKSKLRNWQWAVLIVLFCFAFIFSDNNIFDRMAYTYRISTLKSEISYYEEIKKNDSIKLEQLKVDKNEIEKFGREQYLMKKPNEDLFMIED